VRIAAAHADLFLAGEAAPQRPAVIGQGESTDVAAIELRHDAFADFGRAWAHAILSRVPQPPATHHPPMTPIKRMGIVAGD